MSSAERKSVIMEVIPKVFENTFEESREENL